MKYSLIALSLLAAMTASCQDRETPRDADGASTAAAAEPTAEDATGATSMDAQDDSMQAPTGAAATSQDDPVALGLLGTVNEHEINAAKQAEGKKVTGPVLEYAKMMEKEHTENQAKTRSLGELASNADVTAMKEKSKMELQMLGAKSGKEYEAAYVEAMVKGHTEALALIDDRLLPMASAGPVKDHLTQTRGHVAMHLEQAQKLQANKQR